MAIKKSISIIFMLISVSVAAQNKSGIISGPWAGNVELRNATIWVEVAPTVKHIAVQFAPVNKPLQQQTVLFKNTPGNDFNPIKIELNGLDFNTTYQYSLLIDGKKIKPGFATKFTTKDLWQWRKPAPDFSFLTGSCAYFNESMYDRPGKPYGGDSSIFETMTNTTAAFHLWLGDSWYTREVDYNTAWGLNYRASRDRAQPILQKFMASMPQYAIWDDHDYGPDDIGKSYHLKEESRKTFMNFTVNPSYGENGMGIYSVINYSDVDVFLTDDRYFRSDDKMPDSINGTLNTDKTYFGNMQMEWLKNALLYSKATFKVIATGGQVLNPLSIAECMHSYTKEYNELMEFLASQKISGVLFFSGDRHHSEIIKLTRPGLYPLYDVTNSPYTAGVSTVKGVELTNPARVTGTLVEVQNFTKVSVSGNKNERVMKVEFIGVKGDKLSEWSVFEKELKSLERE